MPKSRTGNRKVGRINRPEYALDRMFDRLLPPNPSNEAPQVLHHYTGWKGAEGILRSQQFWATAHDCTNDDAELESADDIIIEVAKELHRTVVGRTASGTLLTFISRYAKDRVSKVLTACLACFSLARDDKEQWERYGDKGRGICLSLRMVNEPGPEDRQSRILSVDYSESSWREFVRTRFKDACEILSDHPHTRSNVEDGVYALNRFAAFTSMRAKKPDWAKEQEFRHVTLVGRKSGIQLMQRETDSGRKLYLPVRVRQEGKRIALAEILIGPNRDPEETRRELMALLSSCNYQLGSDEYPAINQSAIPPWADSRR